MTITQLRVFVQIAETGSFTKAGQALNMTQPAVSHAISALESELGIKLIIRERRNGVRLTDTGGKILVHIREVLKGIEKAEQLAAAERGLEQGTIHIGTFPAASAYFIPKLISVFKKRYPKLELVLHEGTADEVKEWLQSRMIDAGILLFPTEDMDSFLLKKDKMAAVMHKDHPLAARSTVTIKDLDGEPMVVCEGGYTSPFAGLFKQAGAELCAAFTVFNVSTSINMVREGLGMAILSDMSMAGNPLPEEVVIKEFAPDVFREVQLAVPSMKDASLAAKLFIDVAEELFIRKKTAAD
ncbi:MULTISPECIES: LysR family transcriptional regulator [Bacillus]|uniref:LysR family transcriptional regulator n=1 Tax=Bacillus TaxID=1386 RepID=UPI0003B0AC7F|nr:MULTISPECIES: LysR family transcriptional regulator [Bacillus]AIU83305.1 Hydrogen peroxide-inducible genes activator [Bacillus velezensis]ASB54711.1 putative HTH-type transcriptional regulator YvbU [Bacillus velezensis]ASB67211.1 putative HTH-type transcriptional regulator YvbU [Bacillus velezensis]ASK59866.1 LysR family transcriptional regulator [Bacillus velezensis]ATD74503.1 Hydrogen peroxide-inducible genes activator [Bacillus velezensis]